MGRIGHWHGRGWCSLKHTSRPTPPAGDGRPREELADQTPEGISGSTVITFLCHWINARGKGGVGSLPGIPSDPS